MPEAAPIVAAKAAAAPAALDCYYVLGVRVNAVHLVDTVALMQDWVAERGPTRYIAVTGMHGVTEALSDAEFRSVLNAADLVVPDGMPLIWLARLHGKRLRRRVYGPDLLLAFCEQSAHLGHRHFFYGAAPGVAEQLAQTLAQRFPGLQIAGAWSPPFRPLTPEEEREVEALLTRARPDVIWVGLSTPKQERWMRSFRDRVRVPVMVGVGAAFDFCTGRTRQAPRWMRESGLEWLFRLLTEPRRLWRRYLLGGSKFVFYVLLELAGLKKFDRPVAQPRAT